MLGAVFFGIGMQIGCGCASGTLFSLGGGNGKLIAESGEGYRHRQDCLHGIELVKDSKDARVEGAG